MAQVNINASVIESARFEEQASDVATPAAGFFKQYFKEGGMYWIDDAGVVAGPLGSNFAPSGRLTLTSGTPVTTADVSAAATLYYTPYNGDTISLYDGARWIPVGYTEKSLALGALTASKPYDIWGYLSSGTLALEGLVWTNATTRATALTYQNGRLVKTGDATRLYLGTIYINSSGGQTDDSVIKRNVFNYYNRKYRRLYKGDATSHTYTTGAFRAWNNAAANSFEVMQGVSEDALHITINAAIESSATDTSGFVSIGYDVTNAEIENYCRIGNGNIGSLTASADLEHLAGVGWHTYSAIEYGATTITFSLYTLRGGIWA